MQVSLRQGASQPQNIKWATSSMKGVKIFYIIIPQFYLGLRLLFSQ